MYKDDILDYLSDEEIAELKANLGEKRFHDTFDYYEDVEDETLDAEGMILDGR